MSLLLKTVLSSTRVHLRHRFSSSAANRWTLENDVNLEKILVRIPAYGGKVPVGSLATIKPAPHGSPGFQLALHDPEISDAFKKSLVTSVKPLNLKVSFNNGQIVLIPKEGTNVSWKRLRSSQSRSLASQYKGDFFALDARDLDDPMTPEGNKLSKKLAKAWVPVETNGVLHRKRSKQASKQPLREQRAHALAGAMTDFGVPVTLASRYERLAKSNKKTLRQMMKRVTEFEFDSKQPALE